MRPTKKSIPKFGNEDEERDFWERADSTNYIDWSKSTRETLPKLRPTLRTISIRLPESMIAQLKTLANKKDVPYQSIVKVYLADRIEAELASAKASRRT
jgi:predicted DNA binding CopG/RHH family protein